MAPSLVAVVLILTLAAGGRLTAAIWLDLPSSGTKCVSEDIQTNVVVLADYSLVNGDDNLHSPITTISAKVTSPYGNNLHHQENVTHSQFAFTTNEAGSYLACFWVHGNHEGATGLTVSLDWRIGIAAKDWDSVAKKENIEGIELELRKLEGLVEAIHEKIFYLKHIEAEMREVSETTNARVAWLSIMSIGICIAASVSQFFYLKRYFRKKKLI